ncbi:MAG: hypothetical protein AB7U92_00645 [Piscinibacter sp.]|uniref:hypothetical protein n=1 Tax=Piscinibacter sp. TaxID=1903157 RepID=UPI003D0E33CD
MVEPRLLLLRLWSGERSFRAVVREFEPERSWHFDDRQSLIDFVLASRPMTQGPMADDTDTEGRATP